MTVLLARTAPYRLWPLALLLALTACDDPAFTARKGNVWFDQAAYVQARDAYLDALARADTLPSRLRTAALNNTGLSYLAEGNGSEALAALDVAARAAPTAALGNETHYNGGMAAYSIGQREAALERFRQALLLRENDDDARYNWEVVRRQMQKEQNESGGSPPPQPSDYARALKERAERLAAERRYREAHMLMQQGLEQDETVAAFGDFINRLATVADINTLPPSRP